MTRDDSTPARQRGWEALFWIGLACWIIGFAWHWWRPSLWLLDLVLVPLMVAVYWFGLVAVFVSVVVRARWRLAATVVPALVILTVLVNRMWMVAPQSWFAVHEPLFELGLHTEPGGEYYGNPLPLPLRFLTAGGKVSGQDGFSFFPQWIGVPDDAGGYVHHPSRSPEGIDLYGSMCVAPVALGDGWWMCNMRDTGF